ncbi:MAG: response regulator [Bacteroidota bacterium]|nr:response regulator [Bacteroidota bacterium]MDP4250599.1 response regulator [Bacteroidota bacterium]
MDLTAKRTHTNLKRTLPAVKILAVDDREDNLLSIETILEKEGYEIVKADSGRAALKLLLKVHDFSLILMDVQMPLMDGLETATLIYERDKLKHIPIIFITAHGYGHDLMFKGFKMGAVDYIHKPIDPALLRFKVGVFIELFHKTNELILQEEKLKAINQSLQSEIEERRNSERRVTTLNQQLIESNSELKEINEELDRFAFVASHDLQEPLRKILLFNDMISQRLGDSLDKATADYIRKVNNATGHMKLLVNDLLKYSRKTQTPEDFKTTNLNDLLTEVISDLEMDIKKTKASILISPLPDLVVLPTQMKQLFQNLFSNSLKFSKPGGIPEIEISSELATIENEAENNGKQIRFHKISFKDHGIGFDTKYADDIFTVFKRLHSYHEIEGSGIGLSICKKIVERHRGTIAVQSEPGIGSTFIVTLPETQ